MNKKIASKEFIENVIFDLRIAFHENHDRFWDLLIERMMCYNIKEDELGWVVDSTIDRVNRCLYVADIIQLLLDKRVPIVD